MQEEEKRLPMKAVELLRLQFFALVSQYLILFFGSFSVYFFFLFLVALSRVTHGLYLRTTTPLRSDFGDGDLPDGVVLVDVVVCHDVSGGGCVVVGWPGS